MKRDPHNNLYNLFITLMLAILILFIIYLFIPNSHYNLYML